MPASPVAMWVKTNEPLLWFGGAGHEFRREPSYFYDASLRGEPVNYCLQLTLSGTGFYENAKGGRTLLRPGMAFLDRFPGTFRYGYPPESREVYELAFVTIAGAQAESWCRSINETYGTILDFGGADNPVAPLLLALAHQWYEGSLGDRYLLSGQLYQLLMTVLSTLNRSRMQTTPLVNRALALIGQRATDSEFNVSTLARELSCSREHLTRQFRASTGVSASDYLIQHRLRRAARDMQLTTDKLEQIARRNGFSGANYLCRVFRQHFGMTPASFRRYPGIGAV